MVRDIDKIIIGSIIGPVSLGLYTFVENIIVRPGSLIMNGISRFNFTIFCSEEAETNKIDFAYANNLVIASSSILVLISFLAIITPYIILNYLDGSWKNSIDLLIPLFGLILVKTLYAPIGDYWKSQANFSAMYVWSFSLLFLTSGLLLFGTKFESIKFIAYLIFFLNILFLLASLIFLKRYFLSNFFINIKYTYIRSVFLLLITSILFVINDLLFSFYLLPTLITIIINYVMYLIFMKNVLRKTSFDLLNNIG
jgi:O-antigen/teichoic acid export membrane protein